MPEAREVASRDIALCAATRLLPFLDVTGRNAREYFHPLSYRPAQLASIT